ncbi:MAG: alpha/beta fold hydrolase [Chloroflexi bacterium]|nr:alpha/beta fold hydrolase [Chloroflexota bacterium]
MPYAEVRDTRTWYELRGEGPPLLFISGSGGPLWSMPGTLDPLIERFRVLAYDKRGLGRCEAPATTWEMADFADDAAVLLDVVGWDRCDVVGASFGGMIAQELALRHPQRVAKLVLCCTSPGGDFASYPLHTLLDLPSEERASRRVAITDLRNDPAWQAAHPEEYAALAERYAGGYASEEDEQRHRRLLAARSRLDTIERLPRIASPTLIAGGRHDGIAPLRNQEMLRERIPGSRLELFEGGHGFMREDPRALEVIADWLTA